jgi:kelch-like protein 18
MTSFNQQQIGLFSSLHPATTSATSSLNNNNNNNESIVRLNSNINNSFVGIGCVSSNLGNKLISNVENFRDPNWALIGMQNMEEIRRQGKLCDITLIANDYKFSAHRIVLAASIPYFNAMFLHEMIEKNQNEITINSVDHLCLEQFINYSYNGKITITNENVQSLLIGANFFHLKNIKTACCEFVKKRLTINDALAVRAFAEQLMCLDLVQSVDNFINRNFNKIINTSEFLNLQSSELCDILSRDELNVDSEEQVYDALIRWIKNDEKNNSKFLFDLLKCVRLPLVTPIYLVENISNEPLIKNNLNSRDLLDEAIYYHLLPDKRNQYKTFNLKPRCCNDSFGLIYAIGGLNSSGFYLFLLDKSIF